MAQLRIFVSHSSSDKRACDAFVGAMRGAGADVWYDEHNLGAGQLIDEIQRELHARPVFVVLLSPSALASKWVQRECKWAYTLADADPGRIILPVVVGPIDPKELLAAMLFLSDFKRIEGPRNTPYPQAEAIERTLRLLELTPAGKPPAPVAAPPQPAESASDLLTKGRALIAQKKYAEAIPFFERATQLDPRSFDAWANLGACRNFLKQYQQALPAHERAIALNAKSAVAWNNKGAALDELGRHQEALAAFEQAVATEPNAVRWNGKASALYGLNRYQEALAAYERAITLDPNYAIAWNGKASALWGLKRYADSIAAYDKAIALDPNYATAYKNKAISLRALGRTTEAEAAEKRAKALGR